MPVVWNCYLSLGFQAFRGGGDVGICAPCTSTPNLPDSPCFRASFWIVQGLVGVPTMFPQLKPTSIEKEVFPDMTAAKELYAMVLPGCEPVGPVWGMLQATCALSI